MNLPLIVRVNVGAAGAGSQSEKTRSRAEVQDSPWQLEASHEYSPESPGVIDRNSNVWSPQSDFEVIPSI